MPDLPSIIAETDFGKIIFPIIFVVIWLISAVVSTLNKQKEKARRERLRIETERLSRGGQTAEPPPRRKAPPPLPEAIARQMPNPMPVPEQRRPTPKRPKQSSAPQRASQKPKPAVVKKAAPKQPILEVAPPLRPAEPAIVRANIPGPATAAAISKWMTPQTMRQQFILTEIFQPPKALRAD